MRKILAYIFLIFLYTWSVNASEELKIISRYEWWANESYRYLDWPEWQEILKKREEANKKWIEKLENMSVEKRKEAEEKAKKNAEKKQRLIIYLWLSIMMIINWLVL